MEKKKDSVPSLNVTPGLHGLTSRLLTIKAASILFLVRVSSRPSYRLLHTGLPLPYLQPHRMGNF